MKRADNRWVLTLILLVLCLACTPGGRTKEAEVYSDSVLSGRCAEVLAALARSFGAEPSVEGDRVRVGQDEVRLRARAEGEGPAHSQYALGLAVEVWVNGISQPLTAGSVGIGAGRAEAVQAAVYEWAQLAGVGLLDALGVRKKDSVSFEVARFSAHPGLTGFRGPEHVLRSDERQRELLDRLKGLIGGLEKSPSEFHSISVMLVVEADGSTHGECRLDGDVSPEVLRAVQSYPWPRKPGAYMFKQFYVLRRLK